MAAHGLYLHVPFCVRKCPYCDFLSFPKGRGDFPVYETYAELLKKQMLLRKEEHISVDTVFFGGGTPSLLSGDRLCSVLDAARETFDLSPDAEITLEANPGTVDLSMLKKLRNGGFNRVSFGVQSFNDGILRGIGRIHTAEEAKDAVKMAQDAGFSEINIDLMSALPEQTVSDLEESIGTAVSLGVPHVSCYDLIVAEETPFGERERRGMLLLPDEDTALLMQQTAAKMLEDAGFVHYEISNYALPGHEARHNLHYWHNEPYLGIGCGAHGREGNTRYYQAETMEEYATDVLAGKKWHETEEELDPAEDAKETFLMGMRLKEGVSWHAVLADLPTEERARWEHLAERFVSDGLLFFDNERLCPTQKGWEIQNYWLSRFL